eukprot:GEMP01053496.1.p1 GENE.GEMP01053496.1~~GEMP01053496.1.p1  ORF type:complete len:419 (+),score=106.35 GEMP01053496.1:44-1300(+)
MLSILEWFGSFGCCLERGKVAADLRKEQDPHGRDSGIGIRSDSRITVTEPEPETLAYDEFLTAQSSSDMHTEPAAFCATEFPAEPAAFRALEFPAEPATFCTIELPVVPTASNPSEISEEPMALNGLELCPEPTALSGCGVHCGAAALLGRRDTMEDTHIIHQGCGETFVAVFDGHAGAKAAHYSRDFLYEAYISLKMAGFDTEDALRTAIHSTEETFLQSAVAGENEDDDWVAGTTVAVCVIDEHYKMTVANVGDTEVICGDDDGFEVVSELHRLSNSQEFQRVKRVTGRTSKRLEHPRFRFCSLAVTRALGDLYFKDETYMAGKPSGLVSDPHFATAQLLPGSFVLVASDGLWEGMSKKTAYERIKEGLSHGMHVRDIVDSLAQKAMKGSDDNITAILAHVSGCEPPTKQQCHSQA